MRRRHHFCAAVLAFIGLSLLVFGCASQPDVQQQQNQATESRLSAIQSISTTETDEAVQIEISADGPLTFSALKQPDPPAVVLYLPQTSVDSLPAVQVVGQGPFARIEARNGIGNQTARLAIGLMADTSYTARQEGSKIILDFLKPTGVKEENNLRAQAVMVTDSQYNSPFFFRF